MHGNSTSTVEVTNISAHGIWMQCRDEELFLSFQDFPWFEGHGKQQIENVQEVSPDHFHWSELDIDLCLESIRHPDRFPLTAKL
jgi:hypothetical protein